jgi:hypothetical protein
MQLKNHKVEWYSTVWPFLLTREQVFFNISYLFLCGNIIHEISDLAPKNLQKIFTDSRRTNSSSFLASYNWDMGHLFVSHITLYVYYNNNNFL